MILLILSKYIVVQREAFISLYSKRSSYVQVVLSWLRNRHRTVQPHVAILSPSCRCTGSASSRLPSSRFTLRLPNTLLGRFLIVLNDVLTGVGRALRRPSDRTKSIHRDPKVAASHFACRIPCWEAYTSYCTTYTTGVGRALRRPSNCTKSVTLSVI